MITQNEYMAYFEKVARQHVGIGHTDSKPRFFRLRDPRDLSTKLDKADQTILLLETPENKYSDNSADNYMKESTGAYAVLRRVKADDFRSIDQTMDACESITEEIMKLMRSHNRDFSNRLFGYLPIEGFSSFRVGPLFDGWYGVRMEFKYGDSISMCVDQSKWNFNLG